MDFLEGLLIGPIWSDTEYETRRHTGFYWLIGWLICLLFAYLALFSEVADKWFIMPSIAVILIIIILFLAAPFINRYYYQLNLALRLPILVVHVAKYAAIFYVLLQKYLPRVNLDMDKLPQDGLDFVNQTIARATEFFQSWGQGTGMLLGIAAGGIIIVLLCLLAIVAATVTPALIFALSRQIQHLLDFAVQRLIFRELD